MIIDVKTMYNIGPPIKDNWNGLELLMVVTLASHSLGNAISCGAKTMCAFILYLHVPPICIRCDGVGVLLLGRQKHWQFNHSSSV